MSQRKSGLKRKRHDHYKTPAWVVAEGLAPFVPIRGARLIEPCCGSGSMVRALEACGARSVIASDIHDYSFGKHPFRRLDFLTQKSNAWADADGFVINPPYGAQGALAVLFIKRALELMPLGRPCFAAFLLPADFDSASTRTNLFRDCTLFSMTIVLTRRIEWFVSKNGARPSTNHSWFVWRWPPSSLWPIKYYAPQRPVSPIQW